MNTKIKPFATDNSSAQWVLIINSQFGYVTEDQKNEFLEKYASQSCEATPFGSWDILPPGHKAEFIGGITRGNMGVVDVADCQPVNILDYAAKRAARDCKNYNPRPSTPAERLAFNKFFCFLQPA
jgi:hypothetical protein